MSTESQYSLNPARGSTALRELFPAGAVVADLREPGDPGLLYPAEAGCLGRAVPQRAREFAAGRLCARRALAEFGIVDFPLIAAADRQPLWPAAVTGSITHTTGLCAAVVADKRAIAAIGIDCEVANRVGADLWPTICVAAEMSWVNSLPAARQPAAVALLFSAKEAFYKCQYPLTGEWLDFHDLRVTPQWGALRAGLTVHPTRRIAITERVPRPVTGRYAFHEEFVTVGVALPAVDAQ